MVGNLRGNGFGDALLFVAHLVGAHGIGGVFDARIIGRTAMVAAQQIHFGQLIDVTADGLRCDDEQLGHFLDADITALTDQFENLLLTRRQVHGLSFGLPCKFLHHAGSVRSLLPSSPSATATPVILLVPTLCVGMQLCQTLLHRVA
ncbi:hypothetical protein D3C76_479660 [compost metagenome]